jgi:hypothetical protein
MAISTFPFKFLKGDIQAHKVGTSSWIARSPRWLATVVLVTTAVGCAAEGADEAVETGVRTGTTAAKIVGGSKDDDGAGVAGVVALRVGSGATFELCSGALIAPNVILTARHCVTKNVTTLVSCDENGRSSNGPHVASNEDPAAIGVYVGASPSFAKKPLAVARAVIAPSGPYLCDSDIALVVLATPITDVAPLAVRINSPAREGEKIRSIGYGHSDTESPIGTRFRKDGVEVLAQGKAVSPSKTPLGTHEFEVGKSICQGDSGGPAISEETGAILGVVSRGGNCDEDFGHIYTTTSGFDDLFESAFALAGAAPTLEAGDVPRQASARSSAALSASDSADPEPSSTTGGCSVTRGALPGGANLGGLVVLAGAIAAASARRRRAR